MLYYFSFVGGALVSVIAAVSFVSSTPTPLDHSAAYMVMRNKLDGYNVLPSNQKNVHFSTGNVVERGERAILSGRGFAVNTRIGEEDIRVLESVQIEYLAFVARKCTQPYLSCYTAEDLNVSGSKSVLPKL